MDGSRESLCLPAPGQQPLGLVRLDPARDHPLEHVGQPRQGLDPVQLGGRHQARHDRPVPCPSSEPANKAFLRPKAIGRRARSGIVRTISPVPALRPLLCWVRALNDGLPGIDQAGRELPKATTGERRLPDRIVWRTALALNRRSARQREFAISASSDRPATGHCRRTRSTRSMASPNGPLVRTTRSAITTTSPSGTAGRRCPQRRRPRLEPGAEQHRPERLPERCGRQHVGERADPESEEQRPGHRNGSQRQREPGSDEPDRRARVRLDGRARPEAVEKVQHQQRAAGRRQSLPADPACRPRATASRRASPARRRSAAARRSPARATAAGSSTTHRRRRPVAAITPTARNSAPLART